MFDCANVEMRELLPELAAGSLNAPTRRRVEDHVQRCAECASELETLRLVRGAFGAAPSVDTRAIVAALPKPPVTRGKDGGAARGVGRWVDWRVAAALTMITVGGLSVAVNRRFENHGGGNVVVDSSGAVAHVDSTTSRSLPAPTPGAQGSRGASGSNMTPGAGTP